MDLPDFYIKVTASNTFRDIPGILDTKHKKLYTFGFAGVNEYNAAEIIETFDILTENGLKLDIEKILK